MKTTKYWSILSLTLLGALYGATPALAESILGSAQNFAVLGASTVTNSGESTVWGDLGVYPGVSIPGIDGSSPTGALHKSDAVAQQAQIDAGSAYAFLEEQPYTSNLTGQDLGGRTLKPGVYFFSSSALLSGTLTLDDQNDPNALFVFQIGSSLTIAKNSVVKMLNGGAHDGVYWQVGSFATLGSSTQFIGNIIADQNIILNKTTRILGGRAISLNGSVKMDTNTISNDSVLPIPLPVFHTAFAEIMDHRIIWM